MKKISTLAVILFTTLTMYCQTPELMSYQAVVRDANSELLIDQTVGIKISILKDSSTGSPVYIETHNPSTNSNGLLTLRIGTGTDVSGSVTTIEWSDFTYFIKTEIDPTGGQNYTITGTSQILSVPYALLSKMAVNVINDMVDDADNDPSNEYNTGFTFNGTDLEITDGGSVQTVDLSILDNTNLQAELDTTQTGAGLATDGTYSANTTANYIAGATALNDADDKLDAQAKVNADAISANNTNLQAELDTTQTGAGLATDGTYSANTTANYIAGATALNDADDKLDAQAKVNADAISANNTNLQAELDTTQTGAGLATDGTYSANTTANYIAGATALNDADDKLDAQAKVNADAISANNTNLQAELDTTQTGAGLATDGTYSANTTANYIAGATALNDADDKLDAQAKVNADAISANNTNLQAELDTTQTGAGLATDGTYSANTTANYIAGATALNDADDKLDAQAKVNADAISANNTNLQAELDTTQTGAGLATDGTYSANTTANYIAGATALNDADDKLDAQAKVNADAISANNTNLQAELDTTQTGAGLATDGTYSANTTANYIAGATALNDADDKLDAQAKVNADAISANNTNLQAELDTTQTGAGLATDGTYSANTTANYIAGATALNDADDKLDAQAKVNADAISANNTNLQAELDTTQTGAGLATDGTYSANTTANYIAGATALNDADDKLDATGKSKCRCNQC